QMLEEIARALLERISQTDKQKLVTYDLQSQYLSAVDGYAAAVYSARHISKALSIMRERDQFLMPNLLRFAHNVIDKAIVALNGYFYPTVLDFAGYKAACNLNDWWDLERELTAKSNPFASFYPHAAIPLITAFNPDVVSISVTEESQLVPALTLAAQVRSRSTAHIVWGGEEAAKLESKILREPKFFEFVDSVIAKDAETVLPLLVNAICTSGALGLVPNVGCLS